MRLFTARQISGWAIPRNRGEFLAISVDVKRAAFPPLT
jgi:hypothetical protein